MMCQANCVLMSLLLMIADGFTVLGPSAPLVAPLGSSVVLPCIVDEVSLMDSLEVQWRRTDAETLVHLYQDGESQPEVQEEDYHDRAHFFTEEIQHGNFSLRLDDLRAGDEGRYTCRVYIEQDSGETLVEIKHVERLLVSGSDESISASVGEDLTLNCSVDSHITPEHFEQVSWTKTDEDGDILVLLFQNNETFSDSSDERYRDRVEFFTAEVPKGNFSLKLKKVRTEDKGVYMCLVFAGGASANATVILERLGFSVLHMIMMVLCSSASGSALLLCCLIYCRSPTKGFKVDGSTGPKTFPVGGSAILPCLVDNCLLLRNLKVEWKRTDSETLVHLYEDGESRAEKQHKDYQQRAHFIAEEIKNGNFSLRLDDLRAEDAGKYTCTVYSDQDCMHSEEAEVEIQQLDIKYTRHTLAPLGSSVVLPCSVAALSIMEGLQVEWRRTDSETLVHLYQDGESQTEKQHKDYHDRAHFFTEDIQHGNFSLRLNDLRAEDEGQYTCRVYRNKREVLSINQNLELKLLDTVFRLQIFLVFCPNILMFLAFVLWGVSEGSLFETVSCCSLYFLRPLMLLWVAPYINEFTCKMKGWILNYSYDTEHIVFSAVLYSVLFKSAWEKILNYTEFECVVIIILFVIVLLFNLIYIIFLLIRFIGTISIWIQTLFYIVVGITFRTLPSLQFILLFYAVGSARTEFFIVAVLPVFLTVTRYNWDLTCGQEMGCSLPVRRSVWFVLMLFINAVMVYFYNIALENEKDRIGWACMIAFLQLLWAVINFTWSFKWDLPRVVPVYVFGSVVGVSLSSVTLMTELTLKTVNGHGSVGDLRVIVFSFEFLFTLFLLILLVFEPWMKPYLQSCHKAIKSPQTPTAGSQNDDSQAAAASDETPTNESNQNLKTAESHEMNHLLNQDQEAIRCDVTEEAQT